MKHLERALDGQNQWWKYLLIFVIAFIGGQFIGSIPMAVVMVFKMITSGEPVVPAENNMDLSVFGIGSNLGLVLMIIPFIVSLVLGILMIDSFHKRKLPDVINGGREIRWSRGLSGFLLWIGLMAVLLYVDVTRDPENFSFQFNPAAFIPLIIISVLLIPLQAGTEEFFMRGYLAQGIAGWTRNRIWVILIPSILFALMHAFNPEVKALGFWIAMPQYVIFGVFFGIVCVLDDGLEMAIGVHAANNIFSSIFITHKDYAIQTSALFELKEMQPIKETIALSILAVVFIVIMAVRYKWNFNILGTKISRESKVTVL